MTNDKFIEQIAKNVQKYAPKYGICVHSPIIAMAVLESGWGKSELAKCYNYFGMKAGSTWNGDFVELPTKEEVNGNIITVNAKFRAYKSMAGGVKGFFDFINTTRYENLKGITNPRAFLETIKSDGYATASSYVDAVYNVIEKYQLTKYDNNENLDNIAKLAVEQALQTIAKDIIENPSKWGNGSVRKNRLYTQVQRRVNQLLR